MLTTSSLLYALNKESNNSTLFHIHHVGLGSRSYRKSCCFGTSKSKVTVPEQPRGERSTTALKAVAKTGGLSYPHKGKGETSRGIEGKGQ